MLLEGEKQLLQEELEKNRVEAQKNKREVQILQADLKETITWDEHCSIAGKLRRYDQHYARIRPEFSVSWLSI